MQNFIISLINYSAALSVVILLYMALTPFLSKHYSAKGLYYTWLVFIAGLIIPCRPQIITGVSGIKPPAREILACPVITVPEHEWSANTIAQINNHAFGDEVQNIRLWQLIVFIWLAGAAIFLISHCIRHCRFLKMVNRWGEDIADEHILALADNIKKDLGITRKLNLSLYQYTGSPMMIGLFRPRILLPSTGYSKDELCFILKHELVHFKRKDLWYKLLLILSTAMHWFNPIIYIMAKFVHIQCELSCDAAVVHASNADTRKRYCETLIALMKNQIKPKTALSTNLYGGKKGMRKRISLIMDTNKKKIGLGVFLTVILTTFVIGIISVAENPYNMSNHSTNNSEIVIKIMDDHNTRENFGTSVRNITSRPELEFYIEGKDIAQIELTCGNEYLYAVDWTGTQHEKYWNTDYYQIFDEKTQTCTFYPERLYDKTVKLTFDEGFSRYQDIWYRWTAYNLSQWANENNYSHILGYGIEPKVKRRGDMTDEQKLMLAASDDGSGITGLGHIQLDGCPEELTKDRIIIKITDREGNLTTRYIDIDISNDELNQTVVSARVAD